MRTILFILSIRGTELIFGYSLFSKSWKYVGYVLFGLTQSYQRACIKEMLLMGLSDEGAVMGSVTIHGTVSPSSTMLDARDILVNKTASCPHRYFRVKGGNN